MRQYNEALIVAYRTGRLDSLKAVAGEREVGRVIALVDLKTAGHLVLESDLRGFEVVSVAVAGPETWRVRTRETWQYQDRPTRPGMTVGPRFVAEMDMEYEVARQEGRLKVMKGRTLESRYVEPPGLAAPSSLGGSPR